MCGLHADGNKASGFKSMVVAQFTGIGIQKDDKAFVKYNTTTGLYEDFTVVENLHTDGLAKYKPAYENYHIKTSNDSYIQVVSVFVLVLQITSLQSLVATNRLQTLTPTLVLNL